MEKGGIRRLGGTRQGKKELKQTKPNKNLKQKTSAYNSDIKI